MTTTRLFRKLSESLSLESSDNKFIDKRKLIRDNFYMLFDKTTQMFEYENLPPTIPKCALETIVQSYGSACIWRVPNKYRPVGFGPSFQFSALDSSGQDVDTSAGLLFAFPYILADAPDPYDQPYKVVITSPGFNPTISETLEINKDVVIIKNDTYFRGLTRLHKKYAYLLSEAEISLRSTLICLRDQLTFIAKTEPQRASVSKYMQDRENGVFASILAPDFGAPLEAIPSDGRSNAVELAVNGRQAIYAAWYNEIGLNPSFSLKREYTSAQEIDTNTDLLVPHIDDMLQCRELACESINALFGTNITVRKASAWEIKERQINNALAVEEAEVEALESSGKEGGEENVDSDLRRSSDNSSGESVS